MNASAGISKKTAILLVAAISVAAYAAALQNGFVWDDSTQILWNWWIRSFGNAGAPFVSGVWGFLDDAKLPNYYRPLVHVVYMFAYKASGTAPWGYHLASIILNACAAILVFLVISRALEDESGNKDGTVTACALAGAAVFAVHPAHVEAVSFASAIAEPLFTLFGLLAIYFHISSDGGRSKGIMSAVFFFAALLTKETAAMILPMILVYDYSLGREKGLKKYLPYAAAAAVYFAMRVYALGGVFPGSGGDALFGLEHAAKAAALFAAYFKVLLLPAGLSVVHEPLTPANISGVKAAFTALFAAGYVVAVIFSRRLWRTALLWAALPLLPVLYAPGIGPVVFAERYLYLPSVGLAVFAALTAVWAVRSNKVSQKTLIAVFAAITVVFAIACAKRVFVWKDNLTLWEDAAKKYPRAAVAHGEYGLALYEAGRLDEAVVELRTVLALNPEHKNIHVNLGAVFIKAGRYDDAARELAEAVRLRPDITEARYNLGLVYAAVGRKEEAVTQLEAAVRLAPKDAGSHYALGSAYEAVGRKKEAENEFNEAARLNGARR